MREFDVRVRPQRPPNRGDAPGGDEANILGARGRAAALRARRGALVTHVAASPIAAAPVCARAVDQRAERYGRSTRLRVGIYSLAVDPQRPWLMLTGGSDPLLRLYDRMA